MTKRLITFLAGVVGAFVFVVAPVVNAAILEYSGESTYTVEYGDIPVSYTHLTLPTTCRVCRSRWWPDH